MLRFSWLMSLLSLTVLGNAQIPNNNLAAFEQAHQGIILLNNADQLLPLQGLDTLRPALLSLGLANDEVLYQTLNAYAPTAYIDIRTESESAAQWPAGHEGAPPNLIILAIDTESSLLAHFPWNTLVLPRGVPVVSCLFGRGQLLTNFTNKPNLLFSESVLPWAQSLVAQTLFGGLHITNTLQEAIGDQFPVGSGFSLSNNQTLAFAPPAALGIHTQILHDSIRSIVEEGRLHGAYPGAQVLVAKSGTIIYHETFGHHSNQVSMPVQKTDIYDLASVTKVSSALTALMKWYGEGSFDLDAPLQKYYPAAAGSNKANLSFREMLAHQARLRPWIPYWQTTLRGNGRYPWSKKYDSTRTNDYRFRRRTFSRDSSARFPTYVTDDLWLHHDYQEQITQAVLKSPLEAEATYRYSGLLFYLLPDIVRTQSGKDYESYLKETFYHPLGAHTMTFNPLRYFPKHRIIPTEHDTFFRMTTIHGHVHDEGASMMGGVSANAGLFSNAYDLAKLFQMYLNGGYYGGRRHLDSMTIAEFTRCQYCDTGNRRGIGFDKPLIEYNAQASSVAEAASPASFGHSGYTGTFVWADPEAELLYIFLSNRVYPTRANGQIYARNIRPRIHTAIYKALEHANKGIDKTNDK